jgi:hypothetical protein
MKEHREQDVTKSGDVLSEALDGGLDDAEIYLDEVESGHMVEGSRSIVIRRAENLERTSIVQYPN